MQAQSKNQTYLDYIAQYRDLAIAQQRKHKVPAAITMAQGILESAAGRSELAVKANNHFGIKCTSDWQGRTINKDDDKANECFRRYARVEDSYEDHSLFLLRKRYESLFALPIGDYKGWAHGLKKAGYATNPRYAYQLIDIIERYDLYKYDGTKDLAVGTSSDGTLRVGTATGTDVSYTNIALKHSDNLYYSYDNLLPPNYTLLNPQPLGTMTSWTGKAEVEGYTKYATAVFTQIDKTTMQPILTREESANMVGGMPLVWDAANNKAVDVPSGAYNIFGTEGDNTPKWIHRDNVYVGSASLAYNKAFNYQYVDCSSLDPDTWYPCVLQLDPNIVTQIYCHTELDNRSHPSWATHAGGFTAILHIEANGGGWGGTAAQEIVYMDYQGFYSGEKPVGYTYSSPSSWFVFYLRGGGVYTLSCDNGRAFTLYPNGTTDTSGAIFNPVDFSPYYITRALMVADLNGTALNAANAVNATNATHAESAWGVSKEVAAGSDDNLVYSKMAGSDFFRIRVGGANEQGYAEIATADDGNEPIYVRQYQVVGSDYFNTIVHQATLLDANGNTSFPGTVSAPNFAGLASESVLTQKIRVGNANPTAGDIWVD